MSRIEGLDRIGMARYVSAASASTIVVRDSERMIRYVIPSSFIITGGHFWVRFTTLAVPEPLIIVGVR